MDDRISPASSSGGAGQIQPRGRYLPAEEERRPEVACTGKSCQSCTAGVIADCVAVCCCPCAVVNILTLAFIKLPWALARRCIGRRRRRRRKRMALEGNDRSKCNCEIVAGIEEAARMADEEFRCSGSATEAEEMWVDLYEFGHLGFGRVSFSGIPSQIKANLGNS